MSPLSSIRQLYKPIQPTIKESATNVVYSECLPGIDLQPYIYCYWELKTIHALNEPFCYRVVADGCIDIFFEVDNPGANYVMGFCRKYTDFQLDNFFHYIGIRFLPTMFPYMFKVAAYELSNRFQLLSQIDPSLASFIENQITPGLTLLQMLNLFDVFFVQQLRKVDFDCDNRLFESIAIILHNCGLVNIETDLNVGLSSRQLRRLFLYYVGDTPKTFSQVVRFQNILKSKPSTQSLKKNKIFFNFGYYDQAHFIKEFKNFYGATPSKAFGR